nr:MAG TPA: hypothetical protein [Bacteriophage sp.]
MRWVMVCQPVGVTLFYEALAIVQKCTLSCLSI